ncbi:hypothetical protein [Mycolicibacterium fortuitum]|uniref:Uncharacterized protein n=1 Tax=Mycolicibacterium fortuitum TaxID=1766 RepID=A0AAE4VC24_MYCFO|nr:hypothetical protein [Mycolicibacterium fortuitum]MDV7192613.1 hypothetical protein [Mycolicibacterium fortuitum]MDV7205514.1 hypothetical protein [Mycolicibacterium fortuitum]MDV7227095.1 hypothetical protein [Mycolicibacterium fortuitum]MDV7259660.1 hypothetical protein [Mycolicibacterium fortuitum]MDV7286223.1 hypothetical protein [Mycolicibacterium fortuitum]
MSRRYRIGDLVRIGRGKRVYRVRHVFPTGEVKLAADAKHPDAAKRVPDEFRSYRPDELNRVEVPVS